MVCRERERERMSLEARSGSPAGLAETRGRAAEPVGELTVSDKRWFVLHTRSRQEKSLAADLDAMGIECYLPLTRAVRYYGRRKARVDLPLFPSYIFLWGDIEQAYAADRTRRVARLISVADQKRFARELASIRLALEGGAHLDMYPGLRVGSWVQVRSGPFKGVRGIVENMIQGSRIWLGVQTLGQGASLEIEGDLLEPIESPESIRGGGVWVGAMKAVLHAW